MYLLHVETKIIIWSGVQQSDPTGQITWIVHRRLGGHMCDSTQNRVIIFSSTCHRSTQYAGMRISNQSHHRVIISYVNTLQFLPVLPFSSCYLRHIVLNRMWHDCVMLVPCTSLPEQVHPISYLALVTAAACRYEISKQSDLSKTVMLSIGVLNGQNYIS